jgi:DNA-binding response OmpR family regulator
MLRVLVCSNTDLTPQLRGTFIGRQGIDAFKAESLPQIRLLASTLGPQLILVDAELPTVRELLPALRKEPATRQRSVVVLSRLGRSDEDDALKKAGANAVLCWPPDARWDETFSRLMTVPARHEARLPVDLAVDTQPDCTGTLLNLSTGGMLLQTRKKLTVGALVGFRFTLPDETAVSGSARVARESRPVGYGVEFVNISNADRMKIGQYLRSSRLG